MTRGVPTYRAVYGHIEDAILNGELTPGDLLPAERDLATQLGVSRSATREAIRALQFQGVVESSVGQGGGTRVATMQSQAMSRLLRLHVALADFPVHDVTELRIALERATASQAAQTVSKERLQHLGFLVERMQDPDLARDDFNRFDTEFHVGVAGAAHNPLLIDMTVAVRESLRSPIQAAEAAMTGWPEFKAHLQVQHSAILDAIASADASRAADVMEEHIRYAYAILTTKPG